MSEDEPTSSEPEAALLAALPETFVIPPHIEEIWSNIDADQDLKVTKGAFNLLRIVANELSSGLVASTKYANAVTVGDQQRAFEVLGKVATSAINAQNAMRQAITVIAARHRAAELEAEADQEDDRSGG